jgi:hypothetical protein
LVSTSTDVTRFGEYTPGFPVVLGLAGEACTGKTTTATLLAPPGSLSTSRKVAAWEHLAFSMPMYELASIRRKVEGEDAHDRMAYAVHAVLVDVFGLPGYGAPPYVDLVDFVAEICLYPLHMEDEKPRAFLQWVGSQIRDLSPDAFIRWMQKKINANYAWWKSQLEAPSDDMYEDEYPPYVSVISDVRLGPEASLINRMQNGILIKLTASPSARRERAYDRDGRAMTEEEAVHVTEQWIAQAPDNLFDYTIDTTDMSETDVVDQIRSIVDNYIGIEQEDDGKDQRERLRPVN